ncbi:hypothetical protein [Pseudonocardia broussonetiae]|nr:hypothetical protein [Pseudonocardia broussonetiae]
MKHDDLLRLVGIVLLVTLSVILVTHALATSVPLPTFAWAVW